MLSALQQAAQLREIDVHHEHTFAFRLFCAQGRPKGEAFVPMSDEKRQAAKLMRTLKASGMSGTMYDRASLQVRNGLWFALPSFE